MVGRCTNPNNQAWGRYGGRGIRVCERWLVFENFYADMHSTHRDGLTIERIDNNGDYEPRNCRWATAKEQAYNRCDNIWIETPEGRLSVYDAAARAGVTFQAIRARMKRGWTGARLFEPRSPRS